MLTQISEKINAVYGPVKSWRYGRSLGIDPIGSISTCSFNCVYCQLGEIEQKTNQRAIFIPTEQILAELAEFPISELDAITLSGSGEPTLAKNLDEILIGIKKLTNTPKLVLTNGTTLTEPEVRYALNFAEKVSVKIDGVSFQQWLGINRPVGGVNLADIWGGLQEFREEYRGEIGIQTMILSPWDTISKVEYIALMKLLQPTEIQLNTPTRPKPLKRQLDGRGNHSEKRDYETRQLKCVSSEILGKFADEIYKNTKIPVRYKQS
ncbi:MAG: radical SAM protein [Okeania sp. SIO2H7]|nr:radical SAM protein [Okeania sp. SIO2H7]